MFLGKTSVWKLKSDLQDYGPKHAEGETSSESTLATLLKSNFKTVSAQDLTNNVSTDTD